MTLGHKALIDAVVWPHIQVCCIPVSPATKHECTSWKSTASNVTESHAILSLRFTWPLGFDKTGHMASNV